MKNLRSLEAYLYQMPNQVGKGSSINIIYLAELAKDGVLLTPEEGQLIGGLLYDNLTGYIPIEKSGKVEETKAHPIVEAVAEMLHGVVVWKKLIGIMPTEEKNRNDLAMSIFRKFGFDPDSFLRGARINWNKGGLL